MPTYETLFITPPNLPEEEEQATVQVLAQVIDEGGGTIVANERMGRRRLAYPISKFDDGVYVRLLYDADVEVPRELERRVRISDKVLRSLTVRLEPEWAAEAKEEAVRQARRRAEEEAERARQAEQEAAAAKERGEGAEAEAPATVSSDPAESASTDAGGKGGE